MHKRASLVLVSSATLFLAACGSSNNDNGSSSAGAGGADTTAGAAGSSSSAGGNPASSGSGGGSSVGGQGGLTSGGGDAAVSGAGGSASGAAGAEAGGAAGASLGGAAGSAGAGTAGNAGAAGSAGSVGVSGSGGTAGTASTGGAAGAAGGGGAAGSAGSAGTGGAAGSGGSLGNAALAFSLDAATVPSVATINQGTAIGEGSLNGATPFTLANLALDSNNKQTITSGVNPFGSTGTVPDTAFGFCDYSGATPVRSSYVTGAKFETATPGTAGADPMQPMAPFYFPLVYNSTNTTTGNAFGGKTPIIGLFDWRPKDIDEALVAAESDDNGKTWFFMQTVLELFPDYSNPISGGYTAGSTDTGCPSAVTGSNANATSANGSTADDGWGHAAVIQLPGVGNVKTGQYLYMLDRNPANIDVAPLYVINLSASSNKFPIWNTNNTNPGNNDIKSIKTTLTNSTGTAGTANAVIAQQTSGLLNPDGIMAVFPTAASAAAGSAVTVLYVQKILNGDNTGSTALPVAEQCAKAPFSGKTNHDISNVRLATTTDGVHFTDLGVVQGLNDPTTVDYNETRWVSPRATLLDINGDGSRWGLLFSGGNCLDGDSDAFHFIGYAESTDKQHWTVYSDINSPIASINTITTTNQAGGASVTIPAHAGLVATQSWFAQRLYAPTATQIDSTHLSMTFAGYGVQTPANNLLNYRQIGNVVLTVSKGLPAGVPNNINTH